MRDFRLYILIGLLALGGTIEIFKRLSRQADRHRPGLGLLGPSDDWQLNLAIDDSARQDLAKVQSDAQAKWQANRLRSTRDLERAALARIRAEAIEKRQQLAAAKVAKKAEPPKDQKGQMVALGAPIKGQVDHNAKNGQPAKGESGSQEFDHSKKDGETAEENTTGDSAPAAPDSTQTADAKDEGPITPDAPPAVGGPLAVPTPSADQEKKEDTVEDWAALVLQRPSIEYTNKLVERYLTGQVSESVFYQIIDQMIHHENTSIAELGIKAAGTVMTSRSFVLLTTSLSHFSRGSKLRSLVENRIAQYQSPRSIRTFAEVLNRHTQMSLVTLEQTARTLAETLRRFFREPSPEDPELEKKLKIREELLKSQRSNFQTIWQSLTAMEQAADSQVQILSRQLQEEILLTLDGTYLAENSEDSSVVAGTQAR